MSDLSPSKQALLAIKKLQDRLNEYENAETEPIAIVGASCRLPGKVNNLDDYWKLLRSGQNAISEIPEGRWNKNDFYDPDPQNPGTMYVNKGGFIDNVEQFDASFFEISPKEAEAMDPQQRLLLETTYHAIENAQIPSDDLYGKNVGVFVGASLTDYLSRQIASNDTESINAYMMSGGVLSVLSGRIAYSFGFTGPAFTIDTACSSSLVALHNACQSIRNGECEAAICAGVLLMLTPEPTINFCKAGMLSKDGYCKTFDDSADGYSRGEGCGVVFLKKLKDAKADNNPILAVIRGTAVNQDGASGGLTVPNGPSQEKVIQEALKNAKLSPHEIECIEAHGTGTSLGDPIEVRSLGNVFFNSKRENPIYLGSTKTNFGHLESAAGIAGLLKLVLQVKNAQIAPHLHLIKPNTHIDWEKNSFLIPDKIINWDSEARLAGVSSFGFCGTNAHVIIENPPQEEHSINPSLISNIFLPISAKNSQALKQLAQSWIDLLETNPPTNLHRIAIAAARFRNHYKVRAVASVDNLNKCIDDLKAIVSGKQPKLENSIYEKYLKGQSIDFRALFAQAEPVENLPLYPFQRQRFWKEAKRPSKQTIKQIWPGERIQLPFSDEIRLQANYSESWPAYIKDHKLYGITIAAYASYVSMLIETGNDLFEGKASKLEEVRLEKPLIFEENKERTVQIILTPQDNHSYKFRIISKNADENSTDWITHISGQMSDDASPTGPLPKSIEVGTEGLAIPTISGEEVYQLISDSEHFNGPSYRCVENVKIKENEIISQLTHPILDKESNCKLYSGIIDSSIHAFCLYGAKAFHQSHSFNEKRDYFHIPFAMEKITFFKTPDSSQQMTCHCLVQNCDPNEETVTGKIILYQNDSVILKMEGFTARKVTQKSLLNSDNTKNSVAKTKQTEMKQHSPKPDKFKSELEKIDFASRPERLSQFLRKEIASIVGHKDPDTLQNEQGLFELGMDSIMTMELDDRLSDELDCQLPATLVFDYPTIGAILEFLKSEILNEYFDRRTSKAEAPANSLDSRLDEFDDFLK